MRLRETEELIVASIDIGSRSRVLDTDIPCAVESRLSYHTSPDAVHTENTCSWPIVYSVMASVVLAIREGYFSV